MSTPAHRCGPRVLRAACFMMHPARQPPTHPPTSSRAWMNVCFGWPALQHTYTYPPPPPSTQSLPLLAACIHPACTVAQRHKGLLVTSAVWRTAQLASNPSKLEPSACHAHVLPPLSMPPCGPVLCCGCCQACAALPACQMYGAGLVNDLQPPAVQSLPYCSLYTRVRPHTLRPGLIISACCQCRAQAHAAAGLHAAAPACACMPECRPCTALLPAEMHRLTKCQTGLRFDHSHSLHAAP